MKNLKVIDKTGVNFEADLTDLINVSLIENHLATQSAKFHFSTGGRRLDVDDFEDTYEHEAEGHVEVNYTDDMEVTISYEMDVDIDNDDIHNVTCIKLMGDIEV